MMLRHSLLFTISLFFFLSCSTTSIRKNEPKPATPQASALFEQAKTDIKNSNDAEALKKLNNIVKLYPDMILANESLYLIGQIYEKRKQTNQAYNAYLAIVQSPFFSKKEFSARLKVASFLLDMNKHDEALSYLDSIIRTDQVKKSILEKAHLVRIDILLYKQKHIPALESMIELSRISPNPSSKEAYKMRALDLVNSSLTKDELMRIVGDRNFSFVRSAAFYQLGKLFFEEKDFRRAESYLSSSISVNSKSRYAELSRHIIEQLRARSKTEPYTIGAVLPLSGKLAPIGERSLRGLQLGLGIFDKKRSRFTLSVIDSESDPDSARSAVEKLVVEDHIVALVGSLLSKTAEQVAEKANDLGVPSFALSQKNGLEEIGSNVFRHALTSKMQVKKLVDISMNQLKLRRFAILYPNDPYGVEFSNLFWDEVLSRGGEISAVQIYAPGETDFKAVIQRLVGTYYVGDRKDEYNLRLKEWKENIKNSRRDPPVDLLPPIVEFDAIFIPDNSRAIGQIAPMLDFNDVKGVQLLGTNLWNTRSFLKRIGKYGSQTIFVDTYLQEIQTKKRQEFETKYTRIFGDKPDSIVIQSYEAASMLRDLIEDGNRSRERLQKALSQISNYKGVSGELNMSKEREIQKPVSALTVQDGKIVGVE